MVILNLNTIDDLLPVLSNYSVNSRIYSYTFAS